MAGVAILGLTQCKKSATAPTTVAAANLVAPASKSVLPAVEGQAFTFPAGGGAITPVLAGQTITVTFSNTTAATPTATVTSGSGNFTASTAFGSCIFTVTSSTISGIANGTVFTINPCTMTVGTSGVATGSAHSVPVTFQFGSTSSSSVTVTATISSTGTVTIGNTGVGTVTVTNATGG